MLKEKLNKEGIGKGKISNTAKASPAPTTKPSPPPTTKPSPPPTTKPGPLLLLLVHPRDLEAISLMLSAGMRAVACRRWGWTKSMCCCGSPRCLARPCNNGVPGPAMHGPPLYGGAMPCTARHSMGGLCLELQWVLYLCVGGSPGPRTSATQG